LRKIFPLLEPRRIVDIGCGVGTWMRAALDLGAEAVVGVDGDYVDRSMLLVDPASFVPADIAAARLPKVLKGHLADPFDLVMCLEVAEHLPFLRAASFVEDLTCLSDVVLFSAAVPFQFGTNHVNEQWPEFWAILFRACGFACWDWLRRELWAEQGVDWWYAQNTLVFAREGCAAAESLPWDARAQGKSLSIVHPQNFLDNLLDRPRAHGRAALEEELQDFGALVEANRRCAIEPPPSKAVARGRSAPETARDVFPWTRIEVSDHEQEVRRAHELVVSIEDLARVEIARREEMEEVARTEVARREDLEQVARTEIARREEMEEVARTEVARREDLEQVARTEIARREEMEEVARTEVARREELEQIVHVETARRQELETKVAVEVARRQESEIARRGEAAQLHTVVRRLRAEVDRQNESRARVEQEHQALHQRLAAELEDAQSNCAALRHEIDILSGSTMWRATMPLRSFGAKLPVWTRRPVRLVDRHRPLRRTAVCRRRPGNLGHARLAGLGCGEGDPASWASRSARVGDNRAGHGSTARL